MSENFDWQGIWDGFVRIWNLQITMVADSPVRLGTIIVAVAMVFAGYYFSRRASRGLASLLKKRRQFESGHTAAIEKLSFYLIFVGVVITVLRSVSFPLTAFTFAGGALAIGLGFGSQNLMNNFISGLILLFEQPVRAGDLIEVEGTYGTIENIGARSTRVLASNNTQIIVPNSFLLQSNVVNFTLSDDILRTQVNVGVAYGSPTRQVESIIREAVKDHPQVLKDPAPQIIFADFGDNALGFEIFFWLRARSLMHQRKVQSDLRYRIDDLFREAEITIAFPQRDVHLNPVAPLQVHLTDSRGEQPA